MPTPLPNWAGLRRLEESVAKISPLASANRFSQQQTSKSAVRTDPGTQARTQIQSQSIPTGVEQVSNFKGKLSQTRQWSQGITALTQQSSQQRRLDAQKAAVQAAGSRNGQRASQQSGPQLDAGSFSGRTNSSARQKIVQAAMSLQGTPYAWGGGGYNSRGTRGTGKGTQNVIGVDCSGLTSYAYGALGIKLPRYSNNQTASGYKTSVKNAQPGDIIGWNRGGHVAIYLGNGQIMEASRPGTKAKVRSLGANEGVFAVRLKLPGE